MKTDDKGEHSSPQHHSNRRTFLQGVGVAAASTFAGCQQSSEEGATTTTTTETTESPSKPGTQSHTYQLVAEPISTLDPAAATGTSGVPIVQNLFETLTHHPNGQTNVKNQLAKSVNISDDGQNYTFELKQGLTYTNGDEVTANDLVYSFERLAVTGTSRGKSYILDDLGIKHETTDENQYKPGTLAVNAPESHTLELSLQEPFHAALDVLARPCFSAIPEGIVNDIPNYTGEQSQQEFSQDPVGSGPFTLESWEKGTSIDLAARPMDEYTTMEGPYVKGVHLQIFEKESAAHTYATTNAQADHPEITASTYDGSKITIEGTDSRGREYGTYGPLENGITADYYRVQELATYYFGFNCDVVPKYVRQAFAHAYNQQEVTETIYKGRLAPAYFFTPKGIFPNGPQQYNELAQEYPYGYNTAQMDEAKSLMEENGHGPDNKYELTLTTYESASMKQIGQLMRDKLPAAHITVKYEQAPFSTLLTRAEQGSLECWSLGWIADYPAPDNFLKLLVPSLTQTNNPKSIFGFEWGQANEETTDRSGWTDAARNAQAAWETIQNHPLPTEEHKAKRNEAYLTIEKANWEDMVMCTAFSTLGEHFDYPWLAKPRTGALGNEQQIWNQLQINNRSDYKD